MKKEQQQKKKQPKLSILNMKMDLGFLAVCSKAIVWSELMWFNENWK